jgi:hypothetical protein
MKFKQCIIIVFIILFVGSFFVYSEEGEDIPRLDNSVFENPQRPAVVFDHDLHNEKAGLEENCNTCHHVYEDKKLVPDESSEDNSCSECHSIKKTKDNSISLRQAFHKRCKDCHFKLKKGPVLCGECHKR